jgi:hypothetical protein
MSYLFESNCFLSSVPATRLEIVYLNIFYQTVTATRLLEVRSTDSMVAVYINNEL